jgi:predicted dehydrogenase
MMSKKKLRIGLIGYQFMGKAHSNAYRQVRHFFDLPVEAEMRTLCGRNSVAVNEAAYNLGWSKAETDWRRVVSDPEIDIIDIVTPGSSHCEIAVAAAEAGKIVFCEKPIGNTLAEAKAMLDSVTKANVANAVFHNYRKCPALALAKQMIEEGKLGQIYHVRALYLQDWIADPQFPLVWRLQKDVAGSGTLGDLGAHIIDSARFLVGEFSEVCGHMKTFVQERPLAASADGKLGAGLAGSGKGKVDVDDATIFLAKFKNGAIGTFESTRFALGRKNYNHIEINGSKGSIVFNLERMNELEYYDNGDPEATHGFRIIHTTEGCHPYMAGYWPVDHIVGYEHTFINLIADAFTAIAEGRPCSPDFRDGYENQRVLDAVEKSSQSNQWVALD